MLDPVLLHLLPVFEWIIIPTKCMLVAADTLLMIGIINEAIETLTTATGIGLTEITEIIEIGTEAESGSTEIEITLEGIEETDLEVVMGKEMAMMQGAEVTEVVRAVSTTTIIDIGNFQIQSSA